MPNRPEIQRLNVHESVENVVPKQAFVEVFDDIDLSVRLVDDGTEFHEADVVASHQPRSEFLDSSWVHCVRAGYDEFDTEAYEDAGVPLTNSSGIHDTTVGELAINYMLSFARLQHLYRDHQNENDWYEPSYSRPFTIEGKTLCVVGLGTLGRGIAERADALGMEVVGVRRGTESVPGISRLYSPDELDAAIADARFVALAVPHNPATDGLMSTHEFERMREDAFLINVARGPIVDQDALVEALDTGDIAGAALDVFETEPLPENSPLWEFEEVIISPHRGSATNRYHFDIAELVVDNVDRFRSGDDLLNRVA